MGTGHSLRRRLSCTGTELAVAGPSSLRATVSIVHRVHRRSTVVGAGAHQPTRGGQPHRGSPVIPLRIGARPPAALLDARVGFLPQEGHVHPAFRGPHLVFQLAEKHYRDGGCTYNGCTACCGVGQRMSSSFRFSSLLISLVSCLPGVGSYMYRR
jgi:hypothetical protein